MLTAFAVAMLPWFTYNYVPLGRFTLSPAGGVGRGLWEGSWQATWPGRVQNELLHLANEIDGRVESERRVRDVAAREHIAGAALVRRSHRFPTGHSRAEAGVP